MFYWALVFFVALISSFVLISGSSADHSSLNRILLYSVACLAHSLHPLLFSCWNTVPTNITATTELLCLQHFYVCSQICSPFYQC